LMADRIAVINQGRVEQYGTPQEIYCNPATPFVAGFVGQGNWLPFEAHHNGHARVGGLSLRLPAHAGERGRLFCRPEAIAINPAGPQDNRFRALVQDITFLGNRCRMRFELEQLPGHPLLAELDPADLPRLATPEFWVSLPPRSLQVFA
ncbi:MAG: TOBE domain-containing protein, partial [Pseudomonas sp.]